jgi:hypothetical protein
MTFWKTLKDNPKRNRDVPHIYYPSLSSNLSPDNLWMKACLHERNRLMEVKYKAKQIKSPYEVTPKRKNRVARRKSIELPLISEYLKLSCFEANACIVIQSVWRRFQASRKAKSLREQNLAVLKVQAFVRGITKKLWYAKWKSDVIYFATRCQARRRQILTSTKWKMQCAFEQSTTTKMQAVIRTFLAKCELMVLVRNKYATIIQAFWRGWQGRQVASNTFLHHMATKIQCRMRQSRAERLVAELRIEHGRSSLMVQKCWRGFTARRLRNKILFDRHKELCRRQIMIWSTEIEHYEKSLQKMLSEEEDDKILEQLTATECDIIELTRALKTSERNIDELRRNKTQVTPEMVAQGWDDEIMKGIKEERETITNLKLDLLLNIGYNYEKLTRKRHKFQDSYSFLQNKITELQESRQELVDWIQKQETLLMKKIEMKHKRMAIADEKRKWRVDHRHSNGKPIKASTDNTSGELSFGFCSGNLNLLQHSSGTSGIIERIELQSHLNELNMFNQALQTPISRICTS